MPRIRVLLQQEQVSCHEGSKFATPAPLDQTASPGDSSLGDTEAHTTVLFSKNRIYRHQIARFHYTTYDVRRGQDVIHPNTSHCNIMLLADNNGAGEEQQHRSHFLYARVLGIYHTNVIYTGEASTDYHSRRLEFLWVRWYTCAQSPNSRRFERLIFPPMANKDSFGFVDPTDVLRACHIIPAFSSGRTHADGRGLSSCAMDAKDWKCYYVNQ